MIDTKNLKKTLATLLIGAAIGAVAGVLYAPDKGRKTRRKISNQKEDLKEMMKVRLHSVLETMKDRLETTTERASKFLEIEKALNSRIMKMTLKIQDECPELSKYIEEMADGNYASASASSDPEVTLRNLKAYADSLDTMHKKYMNEHKLHTN